MPDAERRGWASIGPMPNAVLGNPRDAVTSLAPRHMALGQIVPFEVEVKVSGSTSLESGKVQIVGQWSTTTESGFDFGYDPSFGVYCAFIDTADSDNVSLAPTTKVDSFNSRTIGVPGRNGQIEGTINVSGLSNGETAVLEIWVVLKTTLPPNARGNVHSILQSATTCVTQNPCAGGTRINTGNQTVPLLRVQEFRTGNADVSVQKADDPDPVSLAGALTYTVNVTNTSTTTIAHGVVVTDTLDPHVTFVSASFFNTTIQPCTASGSVVTCNVGALNQGQLVPITITATVNDDAPTDNSPGTSPIAGTCTASPSFDLCNVVNETAITADPNTANNSDSEPTNVIAAAGDGRILVRKAVEPTGAGDQSFQFGGPCGAFNLAEGETSVDCRVPAGAYDVTELDPRPNFEVGTILCDDADSTGDPATRTAHVVLAAAETVTCTFTNVDQRGL